MSETEWACDDCYENPCECPTASQETAMGSNVERLLERWESSGMNKIDHQWQAMCRSLREAVEADRKEGIKETNMDGVKRIAIERQRQVEEEGWTAEHDDGHVNGEIAMAAACCALVGTEAYRGGAKWTAETWMEQLAEKHKDDRLRALEIAGALIAAEIDRIKREAGDSEEEA